MGDAAISARILVADDHETVRMGVRMALARDPQFEVCGEAANGREAIAKVKELHPDAVVLDVSMPLMNGLEAAREIRRLAPAAKIVMFSMYDSAQMMATARDAGADAFVLKSAPGNDFECDGEHVWMRSGEVWWFDHSKEHESTTQE